MMHANACCTCNFISTCDMLGYYNRDCRVFSRTHYSDDFTNASFHAVLPCRTGMHNPNQCVQYIMFKMPVGSLLQHFASSIYVWDNHTCARITMDAQDVLTPLHGLKRVYDWSIYMFTCMSVYCTEHVCVHVHTMAIFIINTTHNTPAESYDHVRMHVLMHLHSKS